MSDDQNALDYCSLVKGAFVQWNPQTQKLSFMLEHDENIAAACRTYLHAEGRSFDSIDELVRYAMEHQWAGCERIEREFSLPFHDSDSDLEVL